MANRCILPVIRQPYVHVPVPAQPAETPVETPVEVPVEVQGERDISITKAEIDALFDPLLNFPVEDMVAVETAPSEPVETKRGRKAKTAQPEPFAP